MSQPFVPGPAHVFLVDNETSTPYYFGLTRAGVDISITRRVGDYTIDIGGEEPVDKWVSGKSAQVTTDFVRWNMATYLIAGSTASRAPVVHDGSELQGEIGTLLDYEQKNFKLILLHSYSVKAAYATMPAGIRFVAACLTQDSLPQIGAKPLNLRLTWQCWRHLDMSANTQSIYGPGTTVLYDRVVTEAALNLIN